VYFLKPSRISWFLKLLSQELLSQYLPLLNAFSSNSMAFVIIGILLEELV
jgi:hypothetical protein